MSVPSPTLAALSLWPFGPTRQATPPTARRPRLSALNPLPDPTGAPFLSPRAAGNRSLRFRRRRPLVHSLCAEPRRLAFSRAPPSPATIPRPAAGTAVLPVARATPAPPHFGLPAARSAPPPLTRSRRRLKLAAGHLPPPSSAVFVEVEATEEFPIAAEDPNQYYEDQGKSPDPLVDIVDHVEPTFCNNCYNP
ncbi:hypothetical protein GUJ93_ZPchr0008g12834 [Zizania palustris]|uniref:Uncharacterized protein n=1 Tax=Zizania palustris TaxID=103762 RepID=A0A8J5VGQ2_ZIZPA|nr:hypothetical protein GUJ93_ZPchr0008g12834 [Zizania palustris]